MNSTTVTLVGTAVTAVKYATTIGGVPVAHFRLAATERRFDRQKQAWVEGDTSFYTVWTWRWLAENVLTSVMRGDPVLVTGRMRVREWEVGEGRSRGVAAEVEATSVGHDLTRGTAAFRRTAKAKPSVGGSGSGSSGDGVNAADGQPSSAATADPDDAGDAGDASASGGTTEATASGPDPRPVLVPLPAQLSADAEARRPELETVGG